MIGCFCRSYYFLLFVNMLAIFWRIMAGVRLQSHILLVFLLDRQMFAQWYSKFSQIYQENSFSLFFFYSPSSRCNLSELLQWMPRMGVPFTDLPLEVIDLNQKFITRSNLLVRGTKYQLYIYWFKTFRTHLLLLCKERNITFLEIFEFEYPARLEAPRVKKRISVSVTSDLSFRSIIH